MITFIEEYKNCLKPEQCKFIIDWIESCKLQPGKMGNGKTEPKYKDSLDITLYFTEQNPINQMIFDGLMNSLEKYKNAHNEINHLEPWRVDANYNAQKYLPGKGYFGTHCESGAFNVSERMLVWMIYLNTIENDGGTEFPVLNKTIKAESGKCVIWPASWTHMHNGVVAKHDTKYIVTGWFSFVNPSIK